MLVQRAGIAAGGEFIERTAGTIAWFCFKSWKITFYCLALFIGWNYCW